MRTTCMVFLLALFLFISESAATIRRVPQDYSLILYAIEASANGDTVLVAEGTYFENLTLDRKITLASLFLLDKDTSHISKTIIDGSPQLFTDGSVISIINGTDSNTVITGFTIRGGTGTKHMNSLFGSNDITGGGIDINSGGATIRHNIITGNNITVSSPFTYGWGGGICVTYYDWPIRNKYTIIESNIISENTITGGTNGGGGIEFWGADGRIVNNTIRKNSCRIRAGIDAGNGGAYGLNTLLIQGNHVQDNVASLNIGGIALSGGGMSITVKNNTVINNTAIAVAGIFVGDTCYAVIDGNYISGNIAVNGFGGGIHFERNKTNSIVMNNIVKNNIGSGVRIFAGSNALLINNTIVGNSNYGVQAVKGTTGYALNNIIWNNTPSQISGDVTASYNLVEGGYTGTGNIDTDPFFVKNDSLYRLSDSSYCIARGADSSQINNVWLKSPVKDYTGVVRPQPQGTGPDLGAIEHAIGLPRNPLPPSSLGMGPKFHAFYERVSSANETDRVTIVDSFFTANPVMPFIEDTFVHFLFRGSATTVNIARDINGWVTDADAMSKLSTTDLWFKVQSFEKDARCEYKFVLDGFYWILDPMNPNIMPGGLGDNSIVLLPGYIEAPEINYYSDIQHGTMFDTTLTSVELGNARRIQVYTPFGYNPATSDSLPVFVWHDANDWIPYGNVVNVLDYLIHHKRIKPHIAVLVYWVNRNNEYVFDQATEYSNFILNELMPYIDKKYRTRKNAAYRGMLGISYGGVITTQICNARPDAFGLAAMMSPAYAPNKYAVLSQFTSAPLQPLKIYLDWGSYEINISNTGKYLRGVLASKGYPFQWNEWHDGHSYGNWRTHIDNVLEYFIPGTAVSVERGKYEIPASFALSQNYPNPFNPSTTIRYAIPDVGTVGRPSNNGTDSRPFLHVSLKIYDLLGREIATLVDEEQSAGWKEVQWNANRYSSGMYLVRMSAGNFIETKKILLMK